MALTTGWRRVQRATKPGGRRSPGRAPKRRLRMSEASITVRIAAASPEADLAAAVWPGVGSVTYPHVEWATQIEQADAHITRWERLRGIRPGRVEIRPLIESTRGVTHMPEIASSSPRVRAVGL